jgi:thiamine-monophosphate kinase
VSAVTSAGPGGHRLLRDVGEDELIRALLTRYTAYGRAPAFLLVGPGDDAAVLEVGGPLVVSTDTLVEGTDFRRDWSGGADVGVKVAAQNFADVAAMGARPLALLVSLAAPPDLPLAWADDLAAGLDDESGRAGAGVAGGDVSQARQVVVTGTALGVLDGPPVLRSGARPGDVVALAGGTGASAAGLALLTFAGSPQTAAALTPAASALVPAHLAPRPQYDAGAEAARAGATALIDTSDGLVRDAGRVAAASAVRIDLDPGALAPDAGLLSAARAVGDPSLAALWVLTGGEDHALVGCFPPDGQLPAAFRPVGRVLEADDGGGDVLVAGRPWTGADGWHHFTQG